VFGDVVVVTALLDRVMHRGHLLKFEGKSWIRALFSARDGL
jgi:hypothetical protein